MSINNFIFFQLKPLIILLLPIAQSIYVREMSGSLNSTCFSPVSLKLLDDSEKCCLLYLLVQELSTLHDRHLNRPTLDDSVDEEQTIEITTKEITQVCQLYLTLLPHLIQYRQ